MSSTQIKSENYQENGYPNSIMTLGSHCSLQVLKGAKDEGFQTILACEEKEFPYIKDLNLLIN